MCKTFVKIIIRHELYTTWYRVASIASIVATILMIGVTKYKRGTCRLFLEITITWEAKTFRCSFASCLQPRKDSHQYCLFVVFRAFKPPKHLNRPSIQTARIHNRIHYVFDFLIHSLIFVNITNISQSNITEVLANLCKVLRRSFDERNVHDGV